MATASETTTQITRLVEATDIIDNVANGAIGQDVITDNGTVVTVATAMNRLVGYIARGTWATGVSYQEKDLVWYAVNATVYVVIRDHISGTFATDLANGFLAVYQSNGIGVDTIADLRLTPGVIDGVVIDLLGHTINGDGGQGKFRWDATSTAVDDNGITIKVTSIATGRWVRVFENGEVANICYWGAVADNATDNATALNNAFAYARANGCSVFFPKIKDENVTYRHSNTLYFGVSDMKMYGDSTSVRLHYTGTGTQLAINLSYGDPQRERCVMESIYLYTETGSKSIDFTGGNYCEYRNFEVQNKTTNAILIYGQGSNGVGPYYNVFDSFSLFGSGGTQIGIQFKPNGTLISANGCNANIINGLKRGAVLDTLIDLRAGHGNLFTNISGELLYSQLIKLNDYAYEEGGTLTSATTITVTDSTQTWASLEHANKSVKISSGAHNGEVRRIASNNATTLTLDLPFPSSLAGSETYEIHDSAAFSNKFVNLRQEGWNTQNPNGITIKPGALFNEFSQLEIGSLGSGKMISDEQGHPSNIIRDGNFYKETFIIENTGASLSKEFIPRSSVLGGLRTGHIMRLCSVGVEAVELTAGSAVITVDHGGASTGTGTESLVITLDTSHKTGFISSKDKIAYSTSSKAIFVNLSTDASVNSAADFIITLTYVSR